MSPMSDMGCMRGRHFKWKDMAAYASLGAMQRRDCMAAVVHEAHRTMVCGSQCVLLCSEGAAHGRGT